ncbi:hypothetical protein Y032_0025g1115 [Ancylostoma ceylanicum]|uniref:Uncharacterized protein n=1 Tax=Ancylostoma ceylanicum TaxID=53326 RepID=A0A016UX22_9BILA|nr:hypothetical protein Y032_0025g1115 [Ancylostoma ceylanicum]
MITFQGWITGSAKTQEEYSEEYTRSELSKEECDITKTKCSLFFIFALSVTAATLVTIHVAREKRPTNIDLYEDVHPSMTQDLRDFHEEQRRKDDKEGMAWHDDGHYVGRDDKEGMGWHDDGHHVGR